MLGRQRRALALEPLDAQLRNLPERQPLEVFTQHLRVEPVVLRVFVLLPGPQQKTSRRVMRELRHSARCLSNINLTS